MTSRPRSTPARTSTFSTDDLSSGTRRLAAILLTLLLLLLAFRLTSSETLRLTLNQKVVEVETAMRIKAGENVPTVPTVGPAFTAVYMLLTMALAGIASFLAARVGALSLRRAGQGAFSALILALALVSTFLAANRFSALVGAADLAASLAAAWTVTLLCDNRLLGNRGRQVIIAAIVAISVLCCAKAFLQKFDEFPATYQEVMKDPDAALRSQGINPNDHVQRELFMSRLRSGEVTGYSAFANILATQMIAAIGLLAGLIVAGLVMGDPASSAVALPKGSGARPSDIERRRHSKNPVLDYASPDPHQISLRSPALIMLPLLLLAACAALIFTDSSGGIIAGALALAASILGILARRYIARWRKPLIITTALAGVLLLAALLGWGFTHHGLPSRSLLFRWHYWTGAVQVIQAHPLAGVGFSNFGDYYTRFKLPFSPEDIKDPHSFFIRLAAEGGIPLALAVGALLLWMLQGAWSAKAATQASLAATPRPATSSGIGMPLLLAAGVAIAWVPLHFLAERATEYAVIITVFLAGIAWLVFAAVMALFDALESAATRVIVLAGIIAALAMLLYDQINMALVIGPVAMLFWIMLALGESTCCPPTDDKPSAGPSPAPKPLGLTLLGSSATVAAVLACALLYGIFAWDPAPYEYAYIKHISTGEHIRTPVATNGATSYAYLSKISDVEALRAFEALNNAIARAPNSIELRLQRIMLLRDVLHKPVADEIRKVLALDNANAGPRLLVALPDSDLPPAERVRILQDALALDQQIGSGEPKRLKPETVQQINATIDRLK
jgi:O-antigen ligase